MPFDFNQLVLLGIGLVQLGIVYLAYLTHESAKRSEANIQLVEKATNSMKDALVASTAKASFAEGKAAERKNPNG